MKITDIKWIGRILKFAKEVGDWSKDQSTKVGAVITTMNGRPVSWGFNGFPMGTDDDIPERHERPLKYKWVCHAERNAMDLSPVNDLSGCVMFVTLSPCSTCAQGIIQRKISTVVVDEPGSINNVPARWREDMDVGYEMLKEAGVQYIVGRADD